MSTPRVDPSYDELLRENEKLRKIARVLTERVERSTDAQGDAFSLFRAAITLEGTVRKRTSELLAVNEQLRREIEERLHAENALRLATAAAEEANLGKTKFLAAVSHDLLQPLNAARLFISTLRATASNPDRALIAKHAEEALATANDVLITLLDISKLDAGVMIPEIESFPIEPLLSRIGHEYALQAEVRGLRFRIASSALSIRTDPRLLERLLRNLISNAVKYTVRGGVVVGCRRRGMTVRIEVWDSGSGIPQDKVDDAFEEFQRLGAPAVEGVGLGLSIVRRIAKLLEHRITVRTRVGKGSVFAVDVPIAQNEPATCSAAGGESRLYRDVIKGKTIVVLDDQETQLQALTGLLHSWGCATITARSVEELSRALAECDKPDFMIADFHLDHGRTGVEAIECVRRLYGTSAPSTAILTADRSAHVRREILDAAAYVLYKPLQIARLRSLLNHKFAAVSEIDDRSDGGDLDRFTTFA